MIRFCGDIHGKFKEYKQIIQNCDRSIQVGDMGIGFNLPYEESMRKDISINHKYIRGNHDNLQVCKNDPRWIPDGYIEKIKNNANMMCVGGAYSIDQIHRVAGASWWPDEELNEMEFRRIIDLYEAVKPELMITHDIPYSISRKLFNNGINLKSWTGSWFDRFFEAHKPQLWIFGHWHERRNEIIEGCGFICLRELEHFDMDI
jgi:hypothetical protein